MKKGHEIKEIVNDSKAIILNDPDFGNIKKIILFGGAVNNKMTFRSDVDLSVEFFKIDLREATLFKKRFLGKLNDRVDLQVYNILLEKIKKEIDKGRIIHEQQDK
ncbi:nucleotidyltransferase domain-containing protein [Candidatus Woesearchaeota archaeon]|nr:nucleotidyltransferase domain-containing protein [Candidatus Woesearchaeota archaeon]